MLGSVIWQGGSALLHRVLPIAFRVLAPQPPAASRTALTQESIANARAADTARETQHRGGCHVCGIPLEAVLEVTRLR